MSETLKTEFQLEVAVQPVGDIAASDTMQVIDALSSEREDFSAFLDEPANYVVVRGRDELHLEENVFLLKARLGVDIELGAPQIIYRETVSRSARTTWERDWGRRADAGSLAVQLAVEPLGRGAGFVFEIDAGCPTVADAIVAEIRGALASVMAQGVLAGFAMTDLKVSLLDISGEGEGAAREYVCRVVRAAFREAADRAAPVLLEPVSLLKVTAPEDVLGDIIGDLSARRGGILHADMQDPVSVIKAHVPVAELFGYANTLAKMSCGQATCTMEPSHYARVPTRRGDDTPPSEPGAAALIA